MIPTRYEPEGCYSCMIAHPEGRFILYADAEKWVKEKIAALKVDERERENQR